MSRVEADEDVPRHRGKGGGRRPWTVEVYRERFLIWGPGWSKSGVYANERDAREGYRAHVRRMGGAGRFWTAVRLIGPDGLVGFEGTATDWSSDYTTDARPTSNDSAPKPTTEAESK